MMYKRIPNLAKLLEKKSFFLFGPRATGKTTLIDETLKTAQVFDLLNSDTYANLLRRPALLSELITDSKKIIVIDEIQKLPSLLDEVHRLIQKRNLKFLLTGSSARKLKHGSANLLAGRAWETRLFPLVSPEINDFNLLRYLNAGGLPQIYQSDDFKEELNSYVNLYLQEEIKAEAVTRNIQAFAEFLDAIALSNGGEINYESLASDSQVSPSTLKNYLSILEDTLIGFKLESFKKTKKRKAISRAKHYLFDIGVTNALTRRGEIFPKSELFGSAFEHFIILEMRAFNSYFRKNMSLMYWRSTSGFEVDLICDQKVAIEIKSTELVQEKHLKGIRSLKEEGLIEAYLIVSLDQDYRETHDGIKIYPWQLFLAKLWNQQIV